MDRAENGINQKAFLYLRGALTFRWIHTIHPLGRESHSKLMPQLVYTSWKFYRELQTRMNIHHTKGSLKLQNLVVL